MNVMKKYHAQLKDAASDADKTDYILRAMYHFANRGKSVTTEGMTPTELRAALLNVL